DRDDACGGLHGRDATGGFARAQVLRRGLAQSLLGFRASKKGEIALERAGARADDVGARVTEVAAQIGREEPLLLDLRQEDLRVALQHEIESRRAALLVPDDEEFRYAGPAGHGDR